MDVLAPSHQEIDVLRAISRADFGYSRSKELCEVAGWRLVDDELDLGYVAFEMRTPRGDDLPGRVAVELRESGRRPLAFVPLFYFDDYEIDREPFRYRIPLGVLKMICRSSKGTRLLSGAIE